jgi:hypothetical protein
VSAGLASKLGHSGLGNDENQPSSLIDKDESIEVMNIQTLHPITKLPQAYPKNTRCASLPKTILTQGLYDQLSLKGLNFFRQGFGFIRLSGGRGCGN